MSMTLDEKIAVMTAFRDGKKIEVRSLNYGSWHDANTPSFFFNLNDYRIKPEPKMVWVNIYKGGSWIAFHESKAEADKARSQGCIACVPLTFTEGEGLEKSE